MEAIYVRSKKIRNLTAGGMLGALVAVCTAYVSVPIAGGYFHPGDALIALSGCLLGPYAAIPAAIGSCMADLLAGYAIYAPFTFVIKGLLGLIAGWGFYSDKVGIRAALMLILGGVLIVGGYFLTDCILYSTATALLSIPWNTLQALVFIIAGALFLGSGLKNFMDKA